MILFSTVLFQFKNAFTLNRYFFCATQKIGFHSLVTQCRISPTVKRGSLCELACAAERLPQESTVLAHLDGDAARPRPRTETFGVTDDKSPLGKRTRGDVCNRRCQQTAGKRPVREIEVPLQPLSRFLFFFLDSGFLNVS